MLRGKVLFLFYMLNNLSDDMLHCHEKMLRIFVFARHFPAYFRWMIRLTPRLLLLWAAAGHAVPTPRCSL